MRVSYILVLRPLLRLSLYSTLVFIVPSQTVRAQSSEDSIPSTSLQNFLDKTHIGGYGEITYKAPNEGDVPRLDIPRFVIYLDHYFSDKWAMKSETEIEHVKLERGEGGEIGLEQAFLDYHANSHIGWRTGLLLIPMGIINQTHEPNTFYSVERPQFDEQVIPTTWREIGTGVYGDLSEGLKYQLYVTEGLKTQEITSEGLDGGKQEGSAGEETSDFMAGSDASHPALSAKLEVLPFAGLRIGASTYIEPGYTHDISRSFFMSVLDARYEHGPLHIRGEGGVINTGDASDFPHVPTGARGGYVEAAYNVMPLFSSAESELLPFVRVERIEFSSRSDTTEANFSTDRDIDRNTITAGLAFKPLDNIILKADYRVTKIEGELDYRQFSLGLGFAY